MRTLGLQAIYQKPRTSRPNPEHRVYPYLLRDLLVDRPGQVWCADVRYIPMRRGFLYLVAIMDWAGRFVLAWRLSNTLHADFCVDAVEAALATHGRPDIFNTHQGAQFPSDAFTGVLLETGVRISMDGKGRFMDNIFVERLWRSLKYEGVYLKAYETAAEAKAGIGHWFTFYNRASQHPSGYVIEGKRLCWSGCDPRGVFWVLPRPLGDRSGG